MGKCLWLNPPMSLMPPAFGQTLGEEDFRNLLGYLLKQ
jgi:hypothetical protein